MASNKKIKDVTEFEEKEKEVKEEEINSKKEKKEKDAKKEKKDKKEGYMKVLSRELKKVVWPSASVVAKYTFAVLLFCVVLCLFFKGIELLAALLKELFI